MQSLILSLLILLSFQVGHTAENKFSSKEAEALFEKFMGAIKDLKEKVQTQPETSKPKTNKAKQAETKLNTEESFDDSTRIRFLRYEEHLYSQARKTEIGDQTELFVSIIKNISPNTTLGIGVDINPQENELTTVSESSKTNRLELRGFHHYKGFNFQADLDLNLGGDIDVGFDPDSKYTYVSYDFNESFNLAFYPFNFDGKVGDFYDSFDITRMFFVLGGPSAIVPIQTPNERIANKTIPGFIFTTRFNEYTKLSAGGGVQTYLYPVDPTFDIENNLASRQWERKDNFGARIDFLAEKTNSFRTQLEAVWHSDSAETGSLLEGGLSITTMHRLPRIMLGFEGSVSIAGENAYRLNDTSTWFRDTAPYLPVYSDIRQDRHSWLGETDFAALIKVGFMATDNFMPYVSYGYQGEDYIFRDIESAHTLRTAEDDQSHGGLQRLGIGAVIEYGDFVVTPDIELRLAKNKVFSNNAQIQQENVVSGFRESDVLFSVNLSYSIRERKNAWEWWSHRGLKGSL